MIENFEILKQAMLVVALTVSVRFIFTVRKPSKVASEGTEPPRIIGVTCGSCGESNTLGASECWNCGAKL